MILLTGIALAILVAPEGWQVPVVIGFAILEVAETAITRHISRRAAPKVGAETLIGAVGRTITDCRPVGTVRVRGEHWRARCDAGVDAGQRIRVSGRDRLTLLVQPEEPARER